MTSRYGRIPQKPDLSFVITDLQKRLSVLERGDVSGVGTRFSTGTAQSAFTDANGHVSPAMPGGGSVRLFDGSGNLIADSTGLIGVMTSGGFAANGSSQSIVGSGSSNPTDITGSSFTLTIARPVRIDYRVLVTGFTSAGSGSGYINGNIVGFDTTAGIIQGTAGTQTGFMWYFTGPGAHFSVIPAGTYTVKMQAAADVGTTWRCVQFFHQVFLLGA